MFVFPGQGSQWVGMGARLWEASPVFAESMERCERALEPFVDWSLREVLTSGDGLERVDVVQPATFAVMVSLAELWGSLGVRPDAVVGHSQGEIAAAAVSGALSLEDAARVVASRSQVIGRELAGLGAMASIPLPAAEVSERIAGDDGLGIAALNGPRLVVVSGDVQAVQDLVAEYQAREVRARLIPVDYASHSAHVERIEAELLDVLAPIEPLKSRVPFFSTVTGGWADTTGFDAGYWYTNLRAQVGFEPAIRVLHEEGFTAFVESSPHPVLVQGIQETLDEAEVTVTGTLRRTEDTLERLYTSAAQLHVSGVPVDWTATGTAGKP
ncbi:acyltransferase domain-containing protein, partial [Kitasatospora sp. NPDC092286]|uniref:acyltransferase domain-containing protein n=1 Tax=Kitasatospora sp. NPDC092286 TaxID=3364087 RepID=UPI00380F30F5